jgi:hypothetical protein
LAHLISKEKNDEMKRKVRELKWLQFMQIAKLPLPLIGQNFMCIGTASINIHMYALDVCVLI